MRVAVYDNLANNGVNHVRGLRRVGVDAHVVPDPRDEFAMSDPRWEEIDVELPSDRLVRSNLPPVKLPEWVRLPDSPPPGDGRGSFARFNRPQLAVARAARAAGRPGVSFAGERGWLLARSASTTACSASASGRHSRPSPASLAWLTPGAATSC